MEVFGVFGWCFGGDGADEKERQGRYVRLVRIWPERRRGGGGGVVMVGISAAVLSSIGEGEKEEGDGGYGIFPLKEFDRRKAEARKRERKAWWLFGGCFGYDQYFPKWILRLAFKSEVARVFQQAQNPICYAAAEEAALMSSQQDARSILRLGMRASAVGPDEE
ncbi:hypothetical protein HAX54_015992 [Datura stramonium]|uniref:Uncharacterized protein n=1 Tax=Datura stramonium TaxID=4076 RepID=A0ABS8UIA8_DATST|nr:hypothetical protein [Datura stramonium]